MKSSLIKGFAACILVSCMIFGTVLPASAATNPLAWMEAQSRQAVEAAVKAGTVPHGTTIYDCEYGADGNGVTTVIRYRDRDGNWIDAATGQKVQIEEPKSDYPEKGMSEEALAEYVDECLKLVNEEREKAGADPVSFSEDVAEAALVRAKELEVQMSHTRPDGGKCYTALDDMGIEYAWASENLHMGRSDPETAMRAWIESKGHRRNLLNEKATAVGIAAYQAENGKLCWVQLFIKEK